jgi:hypothetical protein
VAVEVDALLTVEQAEVEQVVVVEVLSHLN